MLLPHTVNTDHIHTDPALFRESEERRAGGGVLKQGAVTRDLLLNRLEGNEMVLQVRKVYDEPAHKK